MKNLIVLFMVLTSFSAFASRPQGYYNQGTLIDGECLPAEGEGFQVMQLSRDVGHIFGTTEMIDMLEQTAADMANRYPGKDRLQIEDLSQQGGGDIDPHGSHENGQDVDIEYFKADGREFVSSSSALYAPTMVAENGQISTNFDVERNWELMKSLHRHGKVQLIFIDQALKNELIRYARSKGEYNTNLKVIQSLHHEENHQDHFHVRLNCPVGLQGCHSTTI